MVCDNTFSALLLKNPCCCADACSGFYFARPVPSVMAFFKLWLGAAHDVPNPLDVWEQAVYNETLHSNPTGIRSAGPP